MSPGFFIAAAGAALWGLMLSVKGYRKTGASVTGLSLALLLALMPLRAFDLLLKENKAFGRWARPRLVELRLGWLAFSGAAGLLMAAAVARGKAPGARSPGWDEPSEQPGMDGAVRAALDAPAAQDTLMGLAAGGREVRLGAKAREAHMQIVGPTRSGKSQLLFALAAQDMRRGMPVFFMEAKGDYGDFDQFLALAQRCGRGEQVRYFNPQDPRSMTFNPIRPLPGQDATAVANQIARVIGREPTSSGEGQDYYRSVDYAKIQNMAEVFWHTGLDFTLEDCFLYFANAECRKKALRLCKDAKVAAAAREEIEKSPDTTALTSAIRPWTTGSLGALLNTYAPQIVLEDVFAQGQLAYFAIPIGHLQVLANPLGRMLISALLSVASGRQRSAEKPGAASVVLDEFAEFATPAFASFIATVGSAKLWTTLSHQDLGQLKKVQGMDAEAFHSAVFNNTSGCKVCFRTPSPDDAEFWSSILGTYATTEDTERVQKWLFGVRRTGEMSRRSVEHFKIHPNRLKNLAPGSALVFSPGHQDCLIRTARVYPLLSGPADELVAVEGQARPGLDLAAVLKPKQETAPINSEGVRAR